MIKKESRNNLRKKKHLKIRKNIIGTKDTPRLNVFRSNANIYASLIDDENHNTLASVSTLNKEFKDSKLSSMEKATKVGEMIGEEAKKLKITKVVFDRGGYKYHGKVKMVAEGARSKGLDF